MIGLALVTLVATLAAGIIKPFEDAVDKIFTSDYAITAQNNFDPIPPSAANAAAKTPGSRRSRASAAARAGLRQPDRRDRGRARRRRRS